MSSRLSIAEVLARLETQIAFHREKEAHHARQEAVHRDQRALHAAELEKLIQHHQAFQETAAAAVGLAVRTVPPPPKEEVEDFGPGGRLKLTRLVEKIADGRPADEPFGTSAVMQEVERRVQGRRKVDPRLVSIILRRLQKRGRIHLVRAGRPHWEALYVRR